jgi:hypothetical protein
MINAFSGWPVLAAISRSWLLTNPSMLAPFS